MLSHRYFFSNLPVECHPCQLGDVSTRDSGLPGTGQSLTRPELPACELQALIQDTQLRSVVEVHDDRTGASVHVLNGFRFPAFEDFQGPRDGPLAQHCVNVDRQGVDRYVAPGPEARQQLARPFNVLWVSESTRLGTNAVTEGPISRQRNQP